jgi:hypothetical protein
MGQGRISSTLGSYAIPGIDFSSHIVYCIGIFKQSMVTRNRVGIELSYRPARQHGLAELVSWNRFFCLFHSKLCSVMNLSKSIFMLQDFNSLIVSIFETVST